MQWTHWLLMTIVLWYSSPLLAPTVRLFGLEFAVVLELVLGLVLLAFGPVFLLRGQVLQLVVLQLVALAMEVVPTLVAVVLMMLVDSHGWC